MRSTWICSKQMSGQRLMNGLKLNSEKNQIILIHRYRANIPTLLIANVVKVVPKVRNLGFNLNESLTVTDHFRKVCQILRSLRPHAVHTPFEVTKRLVLSLILPHVNYGNIIFTGPDSASQRRLEVALKRRLDHVSHLKSTVTGILREST
jgi:hypothetical protein